MEPIITSLQNQRVKNAVKLRDHRGRQAQDRIIIDGAREILRAIQAGVRVVELFTCDKFVSRAETHDVLETGRQRGLEPLRVTPAVFEKLAYGARAEGVIAVAVRPAAAWPHLSLPENPLLVVLEQVEKPGNLGGVLRTADAVGAAVIVANPVADVFSPNAIRASLGAIFSVPLTAATSQEVLAWLRQQGIQTLAARVGGRVPYADLDYRRPTAFVLGSEVSGLSATWSEEQVTSIALPMLGRVDSLNVSVAAAVLLYEALRQRRSSVLPSSSQK